MFEEPNQPKPELVGWGISPALAVLLLALLVLGIVAGIVVAWKWRAAQ